MSNLNKWATWYDGLTDPEPYGDTYTYDVAASLLSDCRTIEDWGCGKGWFRQHTLPGQTYIGIDGTASAFTDGVRDLAQTIAPHLEPIPEGILIRHVLEHDFNWEKILDNAIARATRKVVLIIFTPFQPETKILNWNGGLEVPDIGFKESDLTDRFHHLWIAWAYSTHSQYGREHIYLIDKRHPK